MNSVKNQFEKQQTKKLDSEHKTSETQEVKPTTLNTQQETLLLNGPNIHKFIFSSIIMNKNIDLIKWGFLLWLFGYLLSFVLFFAVSTSLLGWLIMPFGIVATIYVCLKKIDLSKFDQALTIGIVWTFMAIFLDYLFIVKLLSPSDGYYKLDVYLYYLFTFLIPVTISILKNKNN